MPSRPVRPPSLLSIALAGAVLGAGGGLWLRAHPERALQGAADVGTILSSDAQAEASWKAPDSAPVGVGPAPGSGPGSSAGQGSGSRLNSSLATATLEREAPSPTGGRGDLFTFPDVAERVTPCVVTISSQRSLNDREGFRFFHRFFGDRDPALRGHGSGFIIESSGTILTNNHVVGEADKLTVRLADRREFDARIVGRDEKTDLAVIHIDTTGLPTARFGDSDAVRVGEWVLAVGSPFDLELEHTVTAGIISGKGRANVNLAAYEDFLQTDAAINPGNSGGPLVNLRGEVIGINTAIATHNGTFQGVSFAVPINFARSIVERLLSEGKVTRAWLGVRLEDVSSARARELGLSKPDGVEVGEVTRNSPAESAGLRARDIILAMDGRPTESVSRFRNRVSLCRPGQRVALGILRNGKTQTVTVELGLLTDELLAESQRELERGPGSDEAESIGLQLHELNPELRRQFDLDPDSQGLLVLEVLPESPAAQAGMQPGDLIRSLNRQSVQSLRDFQTAYARSRDGRDLVLRVKRGSQSILVTLERPS